MWLCIHLVCSTAIRATLYFSKREHGYEKAEKSGGLTRFLRLENGIPSHDTANRIFRILDPKQIEQVFRSWISGVVGTLRRKRMGWDDDGHMNLLAADLLAAVLLLFSSVATAALQLSLELGSIHHPAFEAERIRMQPEAGGVLLSIGVLRGGGRQIRDLRLKCRDFDWASGNIRCAGGALKVGADNTVPIDFNYVAASKTLDLTLRDASAASLAGLLPELAAWRPQGKFSATLHLAGSKANFKLDTSMLAFANVAGTQAGEGMMLHVAGTVRDVADTRQWQASIAWQGGEVYWQPWYLKGAGQTITASGIVDATQVRVDAAHAVLPGIGVLDGQLGWNRPRGVLTALSLASDAWQVAPAWAQFGQPLLGETPRVKLDGTARFALAIDASATRSFDLDLDLHGIDVSEGRFVLADLRANVPWRRDAATTAQISSGGGKLGELPLGAFSLPLAMEGWRFGFDKVELPVLDGRLLFENFTAQREVNDGAKGGEAAWRWQLAGALHPLSMPLLSKTLGLPRMEGLLSATIPRIEYADSTLTLNGSLIVSAFDGYLSVAGLKVIDPVGHAPRVVADIDARHLDLAMLTQTFSFGSITGYIDADVRGLEMVGRQPQSFVARIETSPGEFGKRISQRAVQNISSLGGAGAGAAIQRSFLRIFDTFGYEKIGLTCRLVGGICEMGGVEEIEGGDRAGYLMVKGGGLPALSVIGYNRRVSWEELVSRLEAIAAGNSRPVIE